MSDHSPTMRENVVGLDMVPLIPDEIGLRIRH